MRAPDVAGPLVGYRAWRVTGLDPRLKHQPLVLRSMQTRSPWPRKHDLVADCIEGFGAQPHEPPSPNCACGIYCLDSLAAVLNEITVRVASGRRDLIVLGRVELDGVVLRGEHGTRGQRARISCLFTPTPGGPVNVDAVAEAYGVAVEDIDLIADVCESGLYPECGMKETMARMYGERSAS